MTDTLIKEIEITLEYFRTEFPKNCETNNQHWADPIDAHAGGVSANDLEAIKNILQQREISDNKYIKWEVNLSPAEFASMKKSKREKALAEAV